MKQLSSRRWVRVAIATGALAVGAASPVVAADHWSDTTGSYVESTGDDLRVKDTKCDGDPPYGKYIMQNDGTTYRMHNNGGCGTTLLDDKSATITHVQACRDTTWAEDNCGGWNEG